MNYEGTINYDHKWIKKTRRVGLWLKKILQLIWDSRYWLQAVDYGVHKLWEANNVGVINLLDSMFDLVYLSIL